MLTSLPFYALMMAQCGHIWGLWTLMTEIPSYMKRVLGMDIQSVITSGFSNKNSSIVVHVDA